MRAESASRGPTLARLSVCSVQERKPSCEATARHGRDCAGKLDEAHAHGKVRQVWRRYRKLGMRCISACLPAGLRPEGGNGRVYFRRREPEQQHGWQAFPQGK